MGGLRLGGKSALVTGGGSGIGAAIVELFALEGARVVVADVDEVGGRGCVERVGGLGGDVSFVLLDVVDEGGCVGVAGVVGGVDVLVNCAGVGCVGGLLECEGSDLDRVYGVNVRGVFNVMRAFLPGMLGRGGGSVVNVASVGGVVGIRDRLAYCASKFAVVGLSKCVALDYAGRGVRCNCICPGRVETPFVSARLAEYGEGREAAYREMVSSQAMGRMGRPVEVASAALFLASDESSFVTGVEFLVDGGWMAGK